MLRPKSRLINLARIVEYLAKKTKLPQGLWIRILLELLILLLFILCLLISLGYKVNVEFTEIMKWLLLILCFSTVVIFARTESVKEFVRKLLQTILDTL